MERGGDDTTDGRRKTGWLDRKVDVDVGGEDGGELGWVWLGEARGKQGLEQGPTRAIEGAREGNSTPTQAEHPRTPPDQAAISAEGGVEAEGLGLVAQVAVAGEWPEPECTEWSGCPVGDDAWCTSEVTAIRRRPGGRSSGKWPSQSRVTGVTGKSPVASGSPKWRAPAPVDQRGKGEGRREEQILGRWARAADLYEQAVSQDSTDAKAWSNLAQARLNLQEYPQAFSAATRAHDLDPTNPKPLYRLALAQRGMNEPQSALSTLASAPQVPEIQTLSAEIKNDLEVQHLKSDPGSQAGLQSLREGFIRREGADGSTLALRDENPGATGARPPGDGRGSDPVP
ncbi:serine/threonine protein phosphatase PPT1 [Trichosporon asahii var. asahii CBS 8904]|uniref:Serine/threonine protein phosphatase PPT1 n=1 Tax=Trichosporon asahii var. asahii (strain CBS 8904) TaxID=1220162 RepID=K1WJE2_TRIAC|nr:serine/threonine protein phosphatase PPT1 [Trichosporon asahii var. asahii CBS 8904]